MRLNEVPHFTGPLKLAIFGTDDQLQVKALLTVARIATVPPREFNVDLLALTETTFEVA